jgi:hypothetical protein
MGKEDVSDPHTIDCLGNRLQMDGIIRPRVDHHA